MNQSICDLMNELFQADPEAMAAFIELGVEVNEDIVNHPVVPCHFDNAQQPGVFHLRVLGLLNGITQNRRNGGQRLEAKYNDDNKLTGFRLMPETRP